MSKNIFSQMKGYVKQPNRNTFDLSFQNNLTMEFGKLYPVFVKDVIPGDSFRITPSFGLRFMPMAFPVQTRMQANLHFFYVRNRNLWKDWPDFIGRTKQGLTLPYLADPSKQAQTRALGDYMGLPTTLVGNYGIDPEFKAFQISSPVRSRTYGGVSYGATQSNISISTSDVITGGFDHVACININNHVTWDSTKYPNNDKPLGDNSAYFGQMIYSRTSLADTGTLPSRGLRQLIEPIQTFKFNFGKNSVLDAESVIDYDTVLLVARKRKETTRPIYEWCARITNPKATMGSYNTSPISDGTDVHNTLYNVTFDFSDAEEFVAYDAQRRLIGRDWNSVLESVRDYEYVLILANKWQSDIRANNDGDQYEGKIGFFNGGLFKYNSDGTYSTLQDSTWYRGILETTLSFSVGSVTDLSEVENDVNIYKSDALRVSALPFRAYESIYNAFYRNQQNDPFTIDGVAEYNKFIPTNEGGADSTDYELRYRNWELDYLTSAVQSPQQGIAPLVGVTASGEFTFDDGEGNTFTAQATVGDDGDTITGIQIQSDADNTTPNGAVQTGTLHAMREIITNGISISDFRNVNALQRWLEVNMRRGFRYKDQLMSHFGVDAEYKELDMPEFIGGMSESVNINQVTQTSAGDDDNPLGSYAGQASILAQSKHSITHYCDEHGYIIGILSVSPVPNYSQLMPKHFIKHETLDFFFPEFGHIGMQPLTYEEVCPVQSFAAGDTLTDPFGYQRAWSDYIQSVDEVHGLMRTELRNFLINRQFDTRPELGAEFLHINPDDVNDVFTVTDATDKIVGALWFDVQAKRPIPKFGIPRLEA